MAFGAILDRIRSKKRALVASVQQRYYETLKAIASGEEIDPEDAALTVENAGKSEDDLERDIATMQRRFESANEMERLGKLAKTLPKLRAEADKAAEELRAAIAKLEPISLAADAKYHAVELECGMAISHEKVLIENCLNPEILEREKEIQAEQKDIVAMSAPMEEDWRTEKQRLQSAKDNLEGAEELNRRPGCADRTEDIERFQKQIAESQQVVAQLENELERFRSRRRELAVEHEKLMARKLAP